MSKSFMVPGPDAKRTVPTVRCLSSYTQLERSDDIEVLACPTLPVQAIRVDTQVKADLSLHRGLSKLQADDGSFELTYELLSLLAVNRKTFRYLEPIDTGGPRLDCPPQLFATLLALKTMMFYKQTDEAEPRLQPLFLKARSFVRRETGHTEQQLEVALETLEGETFELLPRAAQEMLIESFAARSHFPRYELLPHLIKKQFHNAVLKSIHCPRFFLVDLATSVYAHYEIDKEYRIFRKQRMLVVDSPGMFTKEKSPLDSSRQGKQLEFEVVPIQTAGADRHIMSLAFGRDVKVVYVSAPDAVDSGVVKELPSRDYLVNLEHKGYHCDEADQLEAIAQHGQDTLPPCHIYRREGDSVQPDSYWELKKTTHLKGDPGKSKKFKYLIQAELGQCAGVAVGLTEDSYDKEMVCRMEFLDRKSLKEEMGTEKVERTWGILEEMLRHVLESCPLADVPYTLRLAKAQGLDKPVTLLVSRSGWETSDSEEEATLRDLSRRLDGVVEAFCN